MKRTKESKRWGFIFKEFFEQGSCPDEAGCPPMHPIQRHSSRAAADGTGSNGRKLDYRGAAVIQALPRYTAEGWKEGRKEEKALLQGASSCNDCASLQSQALQYWVTVMGQLGMALN